MCSKSYSQNSWRATHTIREQISPVAEVEGPAPNGSAADVESLPSVSALADGAPADCHCCGNLGLMHCL